MQSIPFMIPIDEKKVFSTFEPCIMMKKITEDIIPGTIILISNLVGIKNSKFIIAHAPTATISIANRKSYIL